MKVISIGNDPKIFEVGSAVQKRQIEYGKMFEKMDLIVLSNRSMNYESRIKLSENTYIYPTNSRNKLFYMFDAFKIIRKLIENYKLKIENYVITTQDPFEQGLVGIWLKLRYGIPLHIQLHTDFRNKYFLFSSRLNFIRFFLGHITLPYADAVRVVSARVAVSAQELNKNITVLPIRVESRITNYELSEKPKNQKILTVARLEKEKDLETAIKAFKIVSDRFPEATFTIAGEGSQKSRLQSLVNSLQLEDKVEFVGWINDLPKLYAEHDIYLSTSLFEGYGMSIVEAAEAGLALVISDAGVAGEIFTPNSGAFIVEPKNVNGFAFALEKLVSDKELLLKMGEAAAVSAQKNIISNEEYLRRYKSGLQMVYEASVTQSFFSRLTAFVKVLFRSNKLLRFIIAGGTAASSQILLLYVFTDILGVYYLYSSGLAFAVDLIISFILQKTWAFRDRGIETVHIQFFKYVLVALSGLLLNTVLMYLWVSMLSIWYIVAQIITGVIIAVYNFLMYRKFIFKHE